MRRRVLLWCLAALLLAISIALRPPPKRVFAERMRALARPFALPMLWGGLAAARHEEPPEAVVARGQQLLALLPQWSDGHVLFASQLAFAASTRAPDPDTAAQRVLAGLAMLEAAISVHPEGSVEYLSTMAAFLEIRSLQNPTLAAALRQRLGEEPQVVADRCLQRSEHLSPSATIADRRTYLLLPTLASALRTADVERALATIAHMQRRLTTSPNRSVAEPWLTALDQLARYLRGDPSITLQSLVDDPLLQDMVTDLPANAHPRLRR